MPNPILIHINKRFHVPLDSIISITKKRWGSIWVAFIDPKTNSKKIAIAKQDVGTLLTIINTYHLMSGKQAIKASFE